MGRKQCHSPLPDNVRRTKRSLFLFLVAFPVCLIIFSQRSSFQSVTISGKDPYVEAGIFNSAPPEGLGERTDVYHRSMLPTRLWDHVEKENPRILVTGAASFMGYHFVRVFHSYAKRGVAWQNGSARSTSLQLVLLDDFDDISGDAGRKRFRQSELRQKYNVSVKESSLCNKNTLIKELETNKISFVFHAYDPVHFPNDDNADKQSFRSLQCFSNTLRAVKERERESGSVIPFFYLSSSVADLAAQRKARSEDAFDPFVNTKRMEESLARNYSKEQGMATVGLRAFNVFGEMCTEDEPLEHLWEWLSSRKRRSSPAFFLSLDFIHAEDAANQILTYIVSTLHPQSTAIPRTVDVGTGVTTPLHDAIQMVSEASNAPEGLNEDEFEETVKIYNSEQKAEVFIPSETKQVTASPINKRLSSFVAWEEQLNFPKGIILTTYLVQLPDPQRKGKRYSSQGADKLIDKYYKSATALHMQVYVIHDGLSLTFLHQFETPMFRFVHVDMLYSKAPKSEVENYSKFQSNNDRRYFFFRKMMVHEMQDKPKEKLPRYVLVTDLFDVHFRLKPWDYFDQYPENSLFMGEDKSKFGRMPWMDRRMKRCLFSPEQIHEMDVGQKKLLLNPGILGGRFDVMLQYFDLIMKALRKSNVEKNCNLPITNYVAYKYFGERLVHGPPLHSTFMSYGKKDGDAYIIHK